MILPTILALLALSVTDPSGDAFGDGTLSPPTAPIYADTAVFDIRAVELAAVDGGTRLSVSLGSLGLVGGDGVPDGGSAEPDGTEEQPVADPADPAVADDQAELVGEVPLTGFLPTVIDVYLVGAGPGFSETLPGPDLDFPTGTAWQYAVRITSDGAQLVAFPGAQAQPVEPRAEAASAGVEAGASAGAEAAASAGAEAGADVVDGAEPGEGSGQDAEEAETEPTELGPADMPRLALSVSRQGRDLVVYLPMTLPDDTRVQAMSGVYDPFSPTGWRPLSPTPSPWAFSGAEPQLSPVIDLLAADPGAQVAAITTGVLPRQSEARFARFTPWPYVMVLGLLLALGGLVLRGRVKPSRVATGAAGVDGTGEATPSVGATGTAVAAVAAADPAAPAVGETDPTGQPEVDSGHDGNALGRDETDPGPAPADGLGEQTGDPPADRLDERRTEDVDQAHPADGDDGPTPAPAGDLGEGLDQLADDDDDDDLYDPVATAADVLAAEVAAADEAGAVDQELLVDDTDELVLDTGEREAALASLLEGSGSAPPATEPVDASADAPADASLGESGDVPVGEPSDAHVDASVDTPADASFGESGDAPVTEAVAEPAAMAADTMAADMTAPAATAADTRDPFGTEAGGTFLLPVDDPRAVEDFLDEMGGEESFWHPRARSAFARPPTIETVIATVVEPGSEGSDDAPSDASDGLALEEPGNDPPVA